MTEGLALNWWDMFTAQVCGIGGCLGLGGAEPWSGPAAGDACSQPQPPLEFGSKVR